MYFSTLSDIGDSCEEDDRCNKFVPNSYCKDKACVCRDDYIPHPTNVSSCLRGEDKIVCDLTGDVILLNPILTPLRAILHMSSDTK